MTWLEKRLKEVGKRKSQLAAALGVEPSRITEINNGGRRIQPREWKPMARFLEWELDQLHLAAEGMPVDLMRLAAVDVQKSTPDLPIFACSVKTGIGVLYINKADIGKVERPPSLRFSANAFAVWVHTVEQSPAFELRDLILVDPNRPAGVGDDALLVKGYSIDDRQPFEGVIRRIIGETEDHWVVRQFKPARDYKIAKVEWPRALYIAGKYSR